MTRRKATKAPIRRASNYPDLLPRRPRYCFPVKVFLFWFVEIRLNSELLAKTPKQGKVPSSVFPKETKKWRQ